jgi:putative methyltransferase (TIGR04325 family)
MIATDWLPRLLRRDRAYAQPSGFHGDYASWQDARLASRGYDDAAILEMTRIASAAARDDESIFERDSVLLPKPERPFPLVACLLSVAMRNQGRLSVLDFGGSLGSTYFQVRPLLIGLDHLRWAVVEQPHYVAVGRREFTSNVLNFFDTPGEACAAGRPDLLLLASVLPYLADPHGRLDELLRLRIPAIVVDRTPFLRSDRDRLTVQVVPPEIYSASYPAWFFGETRFRSAFERAGYRAVEEWSCSDTYSPQGDTADYKGFFFIATGEKNP